MEQMEAERVQLQQLLDTASHDLQAKLRDLDSAHSELHASQMANTHLEQQVRMQYLIMSMHIHISKFLSRSLN